MTVSEVAGPSVQSYVHSWWPPNPRLQRTPAASPPSPLSRKPFGVHRGSLVLVLMAATSSCITVGGRLYPAWHGSVARTRCEATPGKTPTLHIFVRDKLGLPLPSATVLMVRPDDPSATRFELYSRADGQVTETPPLGLWQLEVGIPGFRSVRTRVTLEVGKTCTVECILLWKDVVVVS